jgi:hypothetical protein
MVTGKRLDENKIQMEERLMKRIRLITTLLLAAMMMLSAFGCTTAPSAAPEATQPAAEGTEAAATEATAEPVQIHIYQSKYEILTKR